MMGSMEQPTISQGWRKKSTVTVLYSYSYPAGSKGGEPVSMKEGERLILLEKSNADWWQVRRPGDKSQPFYAPANYLQVNYYIYDTLFEILPKILFLFRRTV